MPFLDQQQLLLWITVPWIRGYHRRREMDGLIPESDLLSLNGNGYYHPRACVCKVNRCMAGHRRRVPARSGWDSITRR